MLNTAVKVMQTVNLGLYDRCNFSTIPYYTFLTNNNGTIALFDETDGIPTMSLEDFLCQKTINR